MYRRLAESIPNDIIDKIYEYGKENPERVVYRFCKQGIINDIAFLNSYDEHMLENREIKDYTDNVMTFSTSCSLTDKKPKQLYKLIKKKYFLQFPTPCIIIGHTIGGLSQRTKERDPNYPDKNHIDWWIYQDCLEDIIADFIIMDDINIEVNKNE